ncbi:MAG: putative Na+/H+ antiporter [Elusimicrobia bacterium]|nr:putative Na+/H+ antiporter [Elusimicrobiota bacterium]
MNFARGFLLSAALAFPGAALASAPGHVPDEPFPRELSSYTAAAGAPTSAVLRARAKAEPLNVAATVIFVLAVLHTFLTARIRHWAHLVEERHHAAVKLRAPSRDANADGLPDEVSFGGQVLHFFGEVEAVFGIWAVVLGAAIAWFKGLPTAVYYIGEKVDFTEPIFVVVIMTLASTRPVLKLAETLLRAAASMGKGRPVAWWLAILTLAPLMGSLITEPAAMTIGALLLAKQFYALKPSARLRYATLGLLFVNVSIGGTLTHFAAPPVLMVAAAWGWDMAFMFTEFGLQAVLGILLSNVAYLLVFRKELMSLRAPAPAQESGDEPVPLWVTAVHLCFLGFTVWMAHYPALFIGGFLFFLAFVQATAHHQSPVELKSPLLVGFFLAGLVTHGGLQAWWIEPVLGSLGEVPLFIGAAVLTAFNDNALITYLATLVPGFTEPLKFAVVAGAVTGGGLTVIANAPNPAGQSILGRHFEGGVSPLSLLLGALPATLIVAFAFLAL